MEEVSTMSLPNLLRGWFKNWVRGNYRRRPIRSRVFVEPLEDRELLYSSLALDFGTPASPVAAGFVGFAPQAYSAATGFGWSSTSSVAAVDRGPVADALTRDFH